MCRPHESESGGGRERSSIGVPALRSSLSRNRCESQLKIQQASSIQPQPDVQGSCAPTDSAQRDNREYHRKKRRQDIRARERSIIRTGKETHCVSIKPGGLRQILPISGGPPMTIARARIASTSSQRAAVAAPRRVAGDGEWVTGNGKPGIRKSEIHKVEISNSITQFARSGDFQERRRASAFGSSTNWDTVEPTLQCVSCHFPRGGGVQRVGEADSVGRGIGGLARSSEGPRRCRATIWRRRSRRWRREC